jgi:acyl carrier protein
MERARILEEVVEIVAHKLSSLPAWGRYQPADYEIRKFNPELTLNHLDLAEVAMDIEDAFGVAFEHDLGQPGFETIAQVVDYIDGQLKARYAQAG